MPRSKGEELFIEQLKVAGLLIPEEEYKFLPDRRFRFDFAWPRWKLAVEIEGATWSGGRHSRGKGFENDCIKYNLAVRDLWRVLRFTTQMVKDGRAIMFTAKVMEPMMADVYRTTFARQWVYNPVRWMRKFDDDWVEVTEEEWRDTTSPAPIFEELADDPYAPHKVFGDEAAYEREVKFVEKIAKIRNKT